jgi:myo-inositol 2-dehydrogenase / D-chiro-inositol 1-dehydrogenase
VAAPLHVGLVGVGRIGAFHAETLLALDGVASLSLADADADRARRVAGELGARAAENAETLVEAGVDALVIATSTPGHAPLLRLAARRGIPAFCEKPVGLDLATIDGVIDDVTRAGILVQVGFQRRFDAGHRSACEAVATGTVGRILLIRAATHDPAPPPEEYIASSGGIFRDLNIHDFDSIRFVSGEEIVEVYADGAALETPWIAGHGDVDVSAAVLRLASGALVIVSGTRRDPLGYDVRLEVFGTKDSVAVGLDARSPLRSVEPGEDRPRSQGYANFLDRFGGAYRGELAAFVEAVRSDGENLCPLTEARAALVAALAADRSRSERRPVAVEEVGLEKAWPT